jgi:hypothetical protein
MAIYVELTSAEATTYGETNSIAAAYCASTSGKLLLKFASVPKSLGSKTSFSEAVLASKFTSSRSDYYFTAYVKE